MTAAPSSTYKQTKEEEAGGEAGEEWLYSPQQLSACRHRANREARLALSCNDDEKPPSSSSSTDATDDSKDAKKKPLIPVSHFARNMNDDDNNNNNLYTDKNNSNNNTPTISCSSRGSNPLLTAEEESLLIRYYAARLLFLIGPNATMNRLKRDIKVLATASLLFRRFFLSNSVMVFDPRAVMVASAFMGSKVEDAMVDVRYLEEGTKRMQAPVTIPEIISAELDLLSGVNFDLMCFHPYKTVLSYTEDLRIFLKSDRGRPLATFPGVNQERPIVGEDLRPMHDEARRIVDDAVVSDIPLLYSPGKIGLAAMMVANEELQKRSSNQTLSSSSSSSNNNNEGGEENQNSSNSSNHVIPTIDLLGYIRARFENIPEEHLEKLLIQMSELCEMLRGLKDGKYGCGNHGIELDKVKAVHKKLKKCKAWGVVEKKKKGDKDGAGGKKKKKKKKRKAEEKDGAGGDDDDDGDGGVAPKAKVAKTD